MRSQNKWFKKNIKYCYFYFKLKILIDMLNISIRENYQNVCDKHLFSTVLNILFKKCNILKLDKQHKLPDQKQLFSQDLGHINFPFYVFREENYFFQMLFCVYNP